MKNVFNKNNETIWDQFGPVVSALNSGNGECFHFQFRSNRKVYAAYFKRFYELRELKIEGNRVLYKTRTDKAIKNSLSFKLSHAVSVISPI